MFERTRLKPINFAVAIAGLVAGYYLGDYLAYNSANKIPVDYVTDLPFNEDFTQSLEAHSEPPMNQKK